MNNGVRRAMRSVFENCQQVHKGKQAGVLAESPYTGEQGRMRWKDKPHTKAQKKAALADVKSMKDYADELWAEAQALGDD